LQRTFKYASLLRISGALHLGIFDQPEKNKFFNRLISPDPIEVGEYLDTNGFNTKEYRWLLAWSAG
jgi:hypothetical protein